MLQRDARYYIPMIPKYSFLHMALKLQTEYPFQGLVEAESEIYGVKYMLVYSLEILRIPPAFHSDNLWVREMGGVFLILCFFCNDGVLK